MGGNRERPPLKLEIEEIEKFLSQGSDDGSSQDESESSQGSSFKSSRNHRIRRYLPTSHRPEPSPNPNPNPNPNPERPGSRSHKYCFTIWNINVEDASSFFDEIKDQVAFACWQVEACPSTGRNHIQAYVRYRGTHSGTHLANALGLNSTDVHWLIARGDDLANQRYCSKDDSRVAGPWEIGVPSRGPGSRSDLEAVTRVLQAGGSLRSIAESFPREFVKFHRGLAELERQLRGDAAPNEEKQVVALIGPPGVGKTRSVYDVAQGDLFVLPVPGGPRDPVWFDGYLDQGHALIDDFNGQLEYTFMLRLLDRYPLRVPIKGGFVQWKPRCIWLTSNHDIEGWYPHIHDLSALRRRIKLVFRRFA